MLYATSKLLNVDPQVTLWKNVPVVSSSRSRTLESMHKIHGILGVPVLIDVAAVGSRAHRLRFWWTNLAPAELLQSAIGRTRRPDVDVAST
jgi:hypothetical protein